MAANLPNSPSVGDQTVILGRMFTWNGDAWQSTPQPPPFTYGPTPPANPVEGSVWVDSADLREYRWIDDGDSEQWVEFGSNAFSYLDTDVTLAANSDTRVASQKAVKTYVDAHPLPGFLYGLTLSNGTDGTNDVDIAPGRATDAGAVDMLVLGSALTKRIDAAWAAGTNQGGLDTGSPANTTYHVHLIKNPTTGAVDALFSTSATSPTMPEGYTLKRRLGSMLRTAGSFRLFTQNGDVFRLTFAVDEFTATADYAYTLTTFVGLPLGVMVQPIVSCFGETPSGLNFVYIADARDSGGTNKLIMYDESTGDTAAGSSLCGGFFTNTSAQFYLQRKVTTSLATFMFRTHGWIDDRGRSGW